LIRSHSNIFGKPRPLREIPFATLSIASVRAIPLSSIILLALSGSAYDLAVSRRTGGEPNDFEDLVEREGGVIRSGETLSIGTGKDTLRWKIAMTEPVMQGVVLKGLTRFLVLPSENSRKELTNGSAEGIENEDEIEDELGSDEMDEVDDDEEEDDDYDIDEAYLANSVLAPPPILSQSASRVSSPSNKPNAFLNGHDNSAKNSIVSTAPNHISITAHSLSHPIASPLLIPRPIKEEDDSPRLYLRTKDLGRLAVFSGDWLVVRSEGTESDVKSSRLMRVFASEGVVDESDPLLDGYVDTFDFQCCIPDLSRLQFDSRLSPTYRSIQHLTITC
jgi:peroxin-6